MGCTKQKVFVIFTCGALRKILFEFHFDVFTKRHTCEALATTLGGKCYIFPFVATASRSNKYNMRVALSVQYISGNSFKIMLVFKLFETCSVLRKQMLFFSC